MKKTTTTALLALALVPLAAGAGPRAGSLDPTFDTDGKVRTDFDNGTKDEAYGLAVQADGKVVVGGLARNSSGSGGWALARYTVGGALDAAFDEDGKVRTSFAPTSSETAYALALQPDGKIVMAGTAGIPGSGTASDFALARYNPDGSLDAGFDGDGKVMTDFATRTDLATAVAIKSDGKVVAAGLTRQPLGLAYDFGVARYNPDGSLDTSFSTDGRETTDISGSDVPEGVAVQPDGKIVVVGATQAPNNPSGVLVRYLPDGTLDPSFDGDGILGRPAWLTDVALQADGKIAVVGYGVPGLSITRLNGDGTLDTAFGSGGTANAGLPNAWANSILVQPNGYLIATGAVTPAVGQEDFALARFRPTGMVDPNFGSGGITVTDLGGPTDFSYTAALAPDGRILVGGVTAPADQSTSDFAVVRYLGAPPPCKVPNVRGKPLRAARASIKRARCAVGKVTRKRSARVKKGRVISQKPRAGATLPNGGRVNLLVSRGRRR